MNEQQQTGQSRMFKCKDCGAEFSAVCSAKARGAAVPHVCPECRKARKRESNRRYKSNLSRRRQSQTAHEAMLARLAARDAAYERGEHPSETVKESGGRRVVTRGRVFGSPHGGGRIV